MLKRLWKHLTTSRAAAARAFPDSTLAAIEAAIGASERRHSAEFRFVLEPALAWHEVRDGLEPRARALQLFASLEVWDTADNNGVLIYVLYADHAIEIVADRGFDAVAPDVWRALCACAEKAFREGRFEAGSLELIAGIDALAAAHFPPRAGDIDELPDAPLRL